MNEVTCRKAQIENLPHLKPVIWGWFNPIQDRGYDTQALYNILAGYTMRLGMITGAHLFPFMGVGGDSPALAKTCLHSHFIISSDKELNSSQYRAARTMRFGKFGVKRYNPDKGGIIYMLERHEEERFKEVFCRKGKNCRKKHIHRDFQAAVAEMY
jgi:hypothetical protein